jgi:hypothetical protein
MIELHHARVPAHDTHVSDASSAKILGPRYEGPSVRFAPVGGNEALSLDFDYRPHRR